MPSFAGSILLRIELLWRLAQGSCGVGLGNPIPHHPRRLITENSRMGCGSSAASSPTPLQPGAKQFQPSSVEKAGAPDSGHVGQGSPQTPTPQIEISTPLVAGDKALDSGWRARSVKTEQGAAGSDIAGETTSDDSKQQQEQQQQEHVACPTTVPAEAKEAIHSPYPLPDTAVTNATLPEWVCRCCSAPNLACLTGQSMLSKCKACNAQPPTRKMICGKCGILLEWPVTTPAIAMLTCVECGAAHNSFVAAVDARKEQFVFPLPLFPTHRNEERHIKGGAETISLIARSRLLSRYARTRRCPVLICAIPLPGQSV